jgi:hypothetical protein
MIEERLRCYVPVGTRTRRVGAGGHSTGGWCWQVLTSSCIVYEYNAASRQPGAQKHVLG